MKPKPKPKKDKFRCTYASMILNYNHDGSSKAKRVYWASRPLDITEGTFTVKRGHKKPTGGD